MSEEIIDDGVVIPPDENTEPPETNEPSEPETPVDGENPSDGEGSGGDIIGGGVDGEGNVTPEPPDEEFGYYIQEEIEKIQQVRLMIGDSPSSPFYPLFDDDEIAQFLKMTKWNVRRATRNAAIAASMNFSQMTYRERTGDIEVWNNVSLQYMKALENIIKGSTVDDFGALVPYFGGIDWCQVKVNENDPRNVRSPLATMGVDTRWDRQFKRVSIQVKNPDGEEWNGQAIIIP